MESWRNRKTLILSRTDMMGLLTPAEYNACVEQAYRMHGEKRFYMDPKGHIVLDKYPGEWEAMPSYIEEPEAAACKWVSIRERDREKYDLPTVFLYCSPFSKPRLREWRGRDARLRRHSALGSRAPNGDSWRYSRRASGPMP
jgi:Ornithine cyclodeaminase/mu-crystallin family